MLCKVCHRYAPDDYIGFLKYLGSPYTPHLNAMHNISLEMCKYFHALVNGEEYKFQEFKDSDPKEYFKNNVEPIFDAINRLMWGYDDTNKTEGPPFV